MTLAATVIAAAIGAAGGYLIGRALTLRVAEAKLLRDAAYLAEQGDAFSDESRALLATLNASPYSFCSEEEIAYFRKLVFGAKYLRDAGRMRGGTFACSATISSADLPLEQFKPDLSQPDGTLLYRFLPPFRVGNSQGLLLQLATRTSSTPRTCWRTREQPPRTSSTPPPSPRSRKTVKSGAACPRPAQGYSPRTVRPGWETTSTSPAAPRTISDVLRRTSQSRRRWRMTASTQLWAPRWAA